MKKWIVLLIIILALLVSGCGIMTPNNEMKKPVANEQKVEDVMFNFFAALSDENYGKVKSLCVKGSDIYNEILAIQEIAKHRSFPFAWFWMITEISSLVDGNLAEVYFDVYAVAWVDGKPGEVFLIEGAICYLQKVGKWRIYRQVDLFLPYP